MHPYAVIEGGMPLKKANKAILLLHGRGSNAENILGLGDSLGDERTYLAAPQAANGTWYPHSFLAEVQDNEPWLSSAIAQVARLIEETALVLPASQIALVGFSQGACLALETAARHPQRYLCVGAFTGGLIGKTLPRYQGDLHQTPIFIGTGDYDPHVPLPRCEESKAVLTNLNAKVLLQVYPGMGHTINADEIETVKRFISLKK